ncbi:MAG: hypothetical protein ABSF83_02830 [Nitrososphaerales archaeon]|jgi:hypothetical protein
MEPNRRRFYALTAAILLVVAVVAVAILVYTEDSYVKVEVTGTDAAYFTLSYDSTQATIPYSQNYTIEVLPNANATLVAHPNATYAVVRWETSGADVLGTGNDTINFLTGAGGSTIQISVVLSKGSAPA